MGQACTSVWILEAIWIWLQGSKLDGYCLFGISTVWIGRITKVAGFVAAFTIFIDILGEEKVHEFGLWMSNLASKRRMRIDEFIINYNIAADARPHLKPEGAWLLEMPALLIGLGVTSYICWLLFSALSSWYWWIPAGLVAILVFIIIYVAFVLIFEEFARRSANGIYFAERVFVDHKLCRYLRIWSAIIFIISFSFDLLLN